MDEQKKSPSSPCHIAVAIVTCIGLVITSSLITLFIARSYFSTSLCQTSIQLDSDKLNRLGFGEEPEWDTTHRIHLDEKNVTLMLTDSADRCYVMPINRNNERRTLVLVHEPLSEAMLDHLAGPYGVEYCGDAAAYLLKDVETVERSRRKREANGTASAEPKVAQPTQPKPGNPGEERASGLNLKYEERNPRCEDLILDCGKDGAIGQTQQCYTWINGVILMKQECTDTNKFKIYMSKPPGRILKIAQREWKVCIERRQNGLRC